jgi:hypothetical protein
MKVFQQREVHEAYAHAANGGQAIHLISGSFADRRRSAPRCFKGRFQIAHLFDQNPDRLVHTAKRLGIRVIKVEYPGGKRQHIDLCASPLERALAEAGCRSEP